MFITFEGGEGSGKSTLIQRLKEDLEARGREVVVTREPGGTPLGEHIRECLLLSEYPIGTRAELMLFLASRVQHLEEVILPALKQGKVVLCDRFNESSIAYQGGGRDLGIEAVQEICDLACQGVQPDATYILDVDPAIGMERLTEERDRMEGESMVFHQKVREAFLTLAKKNPERIFVIDASQSPEKVFQAVSQNILEQSSF